nr:lipoprotein insertase outer membrane protein LolB [Burkholderia sp. TSV86]
MIALKRFVMPRTARGFALAASVCAALALAGCASPPRTNAPGAAATASDALRTASSRAYVGRFAVQYHDELGTARNVYGNFDWQEQGASVTLELRNPLGQTLAIVKSAPNGASLELPNREPQYASDVGELMQKTLGFSLPLDGLRYWLQPSPAPATPAETVRDPQDGTRIKEIRQDGWTIDYLAYADAPAVGVKRVDLMRQEPALDIKLVLEH